MKLNMKALNKLLINIFDNNQSEMARVLKVERTHLNKVFRSNGKGAGINIYGPIINYCKENNLNIEDYIFFT